MTATALVEHFFRHEYGRLVSMLSRRVGVGHVTEVEDAVQSALMSALESWTINGLPDNPSAWLFRAALNQLLGEVRTQTRRQRILRRDFNASRGADDPSPAFSPDEVQDDLLRMLVVSCDESIPLESQLVFALKTLCGFDVGEIASRLFTSEANVYKRLERARNRLRQVRPECEVTSKQLASRLPAVHKVLYLLFTEGYLSHHPESALRRELCEEAIRLTRILAEHPAGRVPETHALLALMHLHLARMGGRADAAGTLLLLEEQDRDMWDQGRIKEGLGWLAKSAEGETFSRYHAEAGIAAEHCLAPTFAETRWERIAESYELLQRFTRSPVHQLNRAVAVAEWKGPAHGLAVLDGFEPPTWLAGSYQWAAVMADLHRRCGKLDSAQQYREVAFRLAPSSQVKELLAHRLRIETFD